MNYLNVLEATKVAEGEKYIKELEKLNNYPIENTSFPEITEQLLSYNEYVKNKKLDLNNKTYDEIFQIMNRFKQDYWHYSYNYHYKYGHLGDNIKKAYKEICENID